MKKLFKLCLLWGMAVHWLLGAAALATPTNEEELANVLVVISSDQHGYWLPEVLEPYQVLENAGYEIDIASPDGGVGKASGTFRLSDAQQLWLQQSSLSAKLGQPLALSDVEASNYAAIYFAGGAGPMFDLVDNQAAQKITRDIYEAGGIVSADCHGPAALVNVFLSNGSRLISNKKLTAKANVEEGRWARKNYPFLLEDKFKALNATYIAKAKNQPNVVVDGRLITGQNPASALPMAEVLVQHLNAQKVAR